MESKIEAVLRFRFRETTSSANVLLAPKTAVNSFATLPLLPRRGSHFNLCFLVEENYMGSMVRSHKRRSASARILFSQIRIDALQTDTNRHMESILSSATAIRIKGTKSHTSVHPISA